MLPGDLVPPDPNFLMAQLNDLRRQIEELRSAKTAESTTVRGGTIDVRDSSGNVIAQIGLVPSIFGPDTASGFTLRRPGGNRVLHYEAPGWFSLYDTAGVTIVSDDIGAGQGLARPWIPVQLFQMFEQALPTTGNTGGATVAPGVLAKWEGRASVSHPWIEVDGIWGAASGTNTATYQVLLGGESVGSWNTTTGEVSRRGPFNVQKWMYQDWVKVEVAITASSGTGQVNIQPLGCYLRQT